MCPILGSKFRLIVHLHTGEDLAKEPSNLAGRKHRRVLRNEDLANSLASSSNSCRLCRTSDYISITVLIYAFRIGGLFYGSPFGTARWYNAWWRKYHLEYLVGDVWYNISKALRRNSVTCPSSIGVANHSRLIVAALDSYIGAPFFSRLSSSEYLAIEEPTHLDLSSNVRLYSVSYTHLTLPTIYSV